MIFTRVFWLIWVLAVILLVITLIRYKPFDLIIFLVLFALTGINMYSQESNKRLFQKLITMVEGINLKPLEDGIKKIERAQRECYLRLFKIETELGGYRLEQERKYRDVVRKVLDLENKLNRKFKLLGETVIKISKEVKEK